MFLGGEASLDGERDRKGENLTKRNWDVWNKEIKYIPKVIKSSLEDSVIYQVYYMLYCK
jgi:hypothetical protein